MVGPPAPESTDHGGWPPGCGLVSAWGETDAEANRYHEPPSPSKPATAAELHGAPATAPTASTATSAAAATLTLDSLLGTAVLPGTRRRPYRGAAWHVSAQVASSHRLP